MGIWSISDQRPAAQSAKHTARCSDPAFSSRLQQLTYTEANLAMKEKALARMQDSDTASRRFRASDSLVEFLKGL